MENRKDIIAIIGGPQFSGKSSIAKLLRSELYCIDTTFESYHNSTTCHNDKTNSELMRAARNYNIILKTLAKKAIQSDYVFDNIILSEQVFLRINERNEKYYPFRKLMLELDALSKDFNVLLIISYIMNIGLYNQRALASGVVNHDYTRSYKEQSEYLSFIDEIKKEYHGINVIYINTDDGEEGIKMQLKKIVQLKRD